MARHDRRFTASVGVRLSGARVFAVAATMAIHLLAVAAMLMTRASSFGSNAGESHSLVVIVLRPPLASPQRPPEPGRKKAKIVLAGPTPQLGLDGSVPLHASPDQPLVSAVPRFEYEPTAAAPEIQPALVAGETVDLLAEYKLRLWRHIDAHRPRGVEGGGTTLIGFRVRLDGTLLLARIARSSGNMLLDRIALTAVRRADPMPRPPTSLTPDQLVFIIPLHFR